MDDNELLKHLLDLESEASSLVDEAQAEADRRTAEGERENRLRYDETYAREVEILENDYTQKLRQVKENYQQQLEAYRTSLKNMRVDTAAFFAAAEKFLVPFSGDK